MRAQHLHPVQKTSILLTICEAVPPQPCQLNQSRRQMIYRIIRKLSSVLLPKISDLMLYQCHVKYSGQPVFVRLDTPYKVKRFASEIINKSTNGYFELCSNCGRQSSDCSL